MDNSTSHKVNPKWTKNTSSRHETVQLLDENIGEIFSVSVHVTAFFYKILKTQAKKSKNRKTGLNETKELL